MNDIILEFDRRGINKKFKQTKITKYFFKDRENIITIFDWPEPKPQIQKLITEYFFPLN